MACILAIDYGEVRIGLAVSDELEIGANPLSVIKRKTEKEDLAKIEDIIKERNVARVVVGLPLNMNGTEGPMAKAAREFAAKIAKLDVEVKLWDERLSTRAAESILIEADLSRAKRKKKKDQVAAAWFLQSYLDAKGMGAADVENGEEP